MSNLVLSQKYLDFLANDAILEVMEGTMASGKTTTGKLKFGLKVMKSPYKIHFIGGKDIGTIERNIIKSEYGLLDMFGECIKYHSKGSGAFSIPHLVMHSPLGDKYIFLFGYSNKDSYNKLRGGRYGCGFIDECNKADMQFIIEGVGRCDDYTLMTLNPDDPHKTIYKQYINKCRSTKKWEYDTPKEILDELVEPFNPGWVHWFFRFEDNLSLTPSQINKMKTSIAPGTQQYNNLIRGIRCKASGLVYPQFNNKLIKSLDDILEVREGKPFYKVKFIQFSSGLDTSYSSNSPDTVAMSFLGIDNNRKLWILDENVLNNKDKDIPFAPSDIARDYVAFLDKNKNKWGVFKNTFVDCADQATIQELKKFMRNENRVGDYIFNNSYKKIKIIDRINFSGGLMQTGYYYVLDHCHEHIRELENYSWDENKINTPCDYDNHTIDSVSYGYIPYMAKIGIN